VAGRFERELFALHASARFHPRRSQVKEHGKHMGSSQKLRSIARSHPAKISAIAVDGIDGGRRFRASSWCAIAFAVNLARKEELFSVCRPARAKDVFARAAG
jgi:hypothetical protein